MSSSIISFIYCIVEKECSSTHKNNHTNFVCMPTSFITGVSILLPPNMLKIIRDTMPASVSVTLHGAEIFKHTVCFSPWCWNIQLHGLSQPVPTLAEYLRCAFICTKAHMSNLNKARQAHVPQIQVNHAVFMYVETLQSFAWVCLTVEQSAEHACCFPLNTAEPQRVEKTAYLKPDSWLSIS